MAARGLGSAQGNNTEVMCPHGQGLLLHLGTAPGTHGIHGPTGEQIGGKHVTLRNKINIKKTHGNRKIVPTGTHNESFFCILQVH